MSIDPVEKRAYLSATPQQREVVRGLLSEVLAQLRGQYLSYQTSHWQSSGDSFYGNHLLFQRLYESVEEQIDTLAEKMVGYLGSDSVAISEQMATIALRVQRWAQEPCPFLRGIHSEKDVQEALRKAYGGIKAAKAMTLGMDDMLMAFANAHDANEYLLQQVLDKPKEKTASLVESRFHQPAIGWGMELTAAGDPTGDITLKVGDPRITWNSAGKRFHADASDIRWHLGQSVSVENPRTGGVALYKGGTPTKDLEGDVQFWLLRGPFGTLLQIWND